MVKIGVQGFDRQADWGDTGEIGNHKKISLACIFLLLLDCQKDVILYPCKEFMDGKQWFPEEIQVFS